MLRTFDISPNYVESGGASVTWMVRGYQKDGSALTGEVDVDEALLVVFGKLLNQPGSDLLGGSFPLDVAALARINDILELQLDTADADYFLDFDADPPATH